MNPLSVHAAHNNTSQNCFGLVDNVFIKHIQQLQVFSFGLVKSGLACNFLIESSVKVVEDHSQVSSISAFTTQ